MSLHLLGNTSGSIFRAELLLLCFVISVGRETAFLFVLVLWNIIVHLFICVVFLLYVIFHKCFMVVFWPSRWRTHWLFLNSAYRSCWYWGRLIPTDVQIAWRVIFNTYRDVCPTCLQIFASVCIQHSVLFLSTCSAYVSVFVLQFPEGNICVSGCQTQHLTSWYLASVKSLTSLNDALWLTVFFSLRFCSIADDRSCILHFNFLPR